MKKTLLIAAAALAAGMLSVQAQSNVYSQNVVGYYNITIPAGKFAMVGNQLLNGTNDLTATFGNGSLVSQSTVLYAWTGSTLKGYTWYSLADGGPGYFDDFGNPATFNATNGVGYFMLNPSGSDVVITVTGNVIQGTNANIKIPVGYFPVSSTIPVTTNIDSSITGLAFEGASQQVDYYHWNVALQKYDATLTYYSTADGGPGWFDSFGNPQAYVAPKVGEGFFINNYSGQTLGWTNTFVIP